MQKKELFWISNLLFVTFIWGVTFVLVKRATDDIAVTWFLFYRFLFAVVLSIVLLVLFLAIHDRSYFNKKSVELVLKSKGWILGFFLYLSYFFQTFGLRETSPSNAAFITGLSVILVPVFLVARGKSLSRNAIMANGIATIGLAFLTINFANLSINIGDIIILGTAVCIAIQIILTDEFTNKEPVMVLALTQFMSMAVLSVIGAIFLEPVSYVSVEKFSEIIWIALIVTVIFATVYAFVVQTFAQKETINPATIAIIFAFEPIFALLYSLYVGEETLGIIRFIGMVFILLATFLIIFKEKEVVDTVDFPHIAEI